MAVSLVSEVVAYLMGSDLTTAERLVLLAIAEQANRDTRKAWQSNGGDGKRRWVLSEVTGFSESGLRNVCQKLAKRGIEVREAFGKDTSGRILYAVYGRQTTYLLPPLGDSEMSPRGGPTQSPRGGPYESPGDSNESPGDSDVSPFPSASLLLPNSSRGEPRQIVLKNTNAKPSEADAVVARVKNENPNLRSLGAFIAHLAKAGELQDRVNQVRAARIKAEAQETEAADIKARQGLPRCQHGKAGGDLPHSVSGQIRCRPCRDIHKLNERKAS